MSSKEAPAQVVDTVASLHRWARQEVERPHGLVDRYEGDAVMATSAPLGEVTNLASRLQAQAAAGEIS